MRALLCAAALAALSCAVMEPPSGGPEDKTPPSITAISPAPGSTGVDRAAKVIVTFSEKIDGDSFRGKIRVFPPAEFSDIDVRGERLEIGFDDALPETTIAVVLRGGYADLHNVRSTRDEVFYFATASRIDTGSVSGRVLFKGAPDSSGVVHLLAVDPSDTITQPSAAQPARIAFAGPNGSFEFRALPTGGERFALWAFTDRNADGRLSTQDEFSALFPDTLMLDPSRPRIDGIRIDIIDPDEPGSIEGSVIDLTGFGTPPTARFDALGGEKNFVVRADTSGSYLVPSAPPGEYIFTAFIDVSGDSLAGRYVDPSDSTATLPEPALSPADTVVVLPGERTTVDPVTLRREGSDAR